MDVNEFLQIICLPIGVKEDINVITLISLSLAEKMHNYLHTINEATKEFSPPVSYVSHFMWISFFFFYRNVRLKNCSEQLEFPEY
jgi:hypothetical protein